MTPIEDLLQGLEAEQHAPRAGTNSAPTPSIVPSDLNEIQYLIARCELPARGQMRTVLEAPIHILLNYFQLKDEIFLPVDVISPTLRRQLIAPLRELKSVLTGQSVQANEQLDALANYLVDRYKGKEGDYYLVYHVQETQPETAVEHIRSNIVQLPPRPLDK